MSGGSGGPIIINNLIDNPDTTADEKSELRRLLSQLKNGGKLSRMERWRVAVMVYSLLGRP